MKKPILLDLFCGGGGAGWGYYLAGFDIIGIDINPHKFYPFTFIQADVFDFDYSSIEFDVVHASPPCQAYSIATVPLRLAGKIYPDLVSMTRDLLISFNKPYVIENVPCAPLLSPITLCGTQFGLSVFRHRKFETSFLAFQPVHHTHTIEQTKKLVTVTGNAFATKAIGFRAMGITHNMSKKEIAQSIPPAYSKYIGEQLIRVVG